MQKIFKKCYCKINPLHVKTSIPLRLTIKRYQENYQCNTMKTRELKPELQRQSLCDLELLRSIFLRTFMKYLPMIFG